MSDLDPWLLGAALTLTAADWNQTKHFDYTRTHETNPLLGRQPSGKQIDEHFLISTAAALGVSTLLHDKWRTAFLGGWVGVEAGMVYNNSKQGYDGTVGIKFKAKF